MVVEAWLAGLTTESNHWLITCLVGFDKMLGTEEACGESAFRIEGH